jgi:hypothetical protein
MLLFVGGQLRPGGGMGCEKFGGGCGDVGETNFQMLASIELEENRRDEGHVLCLAQWVSVGAEG